MPSQQLLSNGADEEHNRKLLHDQDACSKIFVMEIRWKGKICDSHISTTSAECIYILMHSAEVIHSYAQFWANLPLNGLTKEGYRIMHGAFLDIDDSRFVYNDNIKYFLMVYGLWFLMEETAPIRLKGIHFINAPPAMEMLMNMMKPFMKKEMIEMIHFHTSLKNTSKYVPVVELPNEVGRKAGSIHELDEIQAKKLDKYREWFKMDEANGRVNEAKRLGQSKSVNDMFGMKSSFK